MPQTDERKPHRAKVEDLRQQLAGRHVCPFCGVVRADAQLPCPRCTMEDTASTRSATQQRIGPWFVMQARNPSAPGMRFATLISLIRKGHVTPRSIIRGPTTHQLWTFSAKIRGLSREFGLCWHCGQTIETDADACRACGHPQMPPAEPDVLLEPPGTAPELPVTAKVNSESGMDGGTSLDLQIQPTPAAKSEAERFNEIESEETTLPRDDADEEDDLQSISVADRTALDATIDQLPGHAASVADLRPAAKAVPNNVKVSDGSAGSQERPPAARAAAAAHQKDKPISAAAPTRKFTPADTRQQKSRPADGGKKSDRPDLASPPPTANNALALVGDERDSSSTSRTAPLKNERTTLPNRPHPTPGALEESILTAKELAAAFQLDYKQPPAGAVGASKGVRRGDGGSGGGLFKSLIALLLISALAVGIVMTVRPDMRRSTMSWLDDKWLGLKSSLERPATANNNSTGGSKPVATNSGKPANTTKPPSGDGDTAPPAVESPTNTAAGDGSSVTASGGSPTSPSGNDGPGTSERGTTERETTAEAAMGTTAGADTGKITTIPPPETGVTSLPPKTDEASRPPTGGTAEASTGETSTGNDVSNPPATPQSTPPTVATGTQEKSPTGSSDTPGGVNNVTAPEKVDIPASATTDLPANGGSTEAGTTGGPVTGDAAKSVTGSGSTAVPPELPAVTPVDTNISVDDAIVLASRLRNEALDAEGQKQWARAAALYEQIMRLPAESRPPDVPMRLNIARTMSK